jgi:hypothetical protein
MAGRMPGTAALKIVADDETGELESATILVRWRGRRIHHGRDEVCEFGRWLRLSACFPMQPT